MTRACSKNDLTVTYTNVDDGLHLTCKNCRLDENLGYEPRPADIAFVADHTPHVPPPNYVVNDAAIDDLPETFFAGKRFTRDELRRAVHALGAEMARPALGAYLVGRSNRNLTDPEGT